MSVAQCNCRCCFRHREQDTVAAFGRPLRVLEEMLTEARLEIEVLRGHLKTLRKAAILLAEQYQNNQQLRDAVAAVDKAIAETYGLAVDSPDKAGQP